jgi:iron complex outermembrane recepter protein
MRNLFFITFFCLAQMLIFAPNSVFAQTQNLKGTVTAADSNAPLEFATVTLLRTDSTVLDGATTNLEGKFKIKDAPFGKYILRTSTVGYLTNFQNVTIDTAKLARIAISLALNTQNDLNAVTITADKSVFQNDIDKRVYNVEQDLLAEGGSASDVLANIPTVTVDIDGKIAMRGAKGVKIWIDGRPVKFGNMGKAEILQQIPANSIDRIELITNPSAKYDSDGTGGIINIILKKNTKIGFNGSLQTSVGTNEKYQIGTLLNYRTQKINIWANITGKSEHRWRTGITDRTRKIDGRGLVRSLNESSANNINQSAMVRIGVEYMPDAHQTFGANALFDTTQQYNNTQIAHTQYDSLATLKDSEARNSLSKQRQGSYSYNVFYRYNFKKPKQVLDFNATYSKENGTDSLNFGATPLIDNYQNVTFLPTLQRQPTATTEGNWNVQLDYTHPFAKKNKLEVGSRFRAINNLNDAQYYGYARGNEEWLADSSRLNVFKYKLQVFSAYAMYSNVFRKKFGYQIGVRADQTYTTGQLPFFNSQYNGIKDTTFNINYFAWFPTLHLQYKIAKDNELRLSYTRRTNRPALNEVNPFIDYTNSFTIKRGNPALMPEFTHAVELGYNRTWAKHSLATAAYWKFSDNQINTQTQYDAATDVATVTYANLQKRTSYGAEIIAKNEIADWWDLTTTLNGYYLQFDDAFNYDNNINNSGYAWEGKMLSQMQWGKRTKLQISGNYQSPQVLAQGLKLEQLSIGLGFRQTFFDKKLTLGFNISDVFNTLHTQNTTNIPQLNFIQNQDRKRESRIAMLTLTYRFGSKPDNKTEDKTHEKLPETDKDLD